MLLSDPEEVTSFLQEVPDSELTGYKPNRVLGLFKTPTHAGRQLKHTVFAVYQTRLLYLCLPQGVASDPAKLLNTIHPTEFTFI